MNPDRITIRTTTQVTLIWPSFATSAKGNHWVQNWQTIGDERLLGNGHGLAAIMLGSGADASFQKTLHWTDEPKQPVESSLELGVLQ